MKKLLERLQWLTTEEALKVVADEMKKPGANIEKLSAVLDKLLGTELSEEDAEQAEAWERNRRG